MPRADSAGCEVHASLMLFSLCCNPIYKIVKWLLDLETTPLQDPKVV